MKDHIHIALIRQNFTGGGGGGEIFVKTIIDTFKSDENIRFTLISRTYNIHDDNHNKNNIIVNPFYIGRTWRNWSFSRAVCRTLYDHNFDIIQTNERIKCGNIYRSGDGVHREWLRIKCGNNILKKIIINLSPFHRYILYMEKRIYSSMLILAPSTMIKDEIIKHYHVDPLQINVIHNFVQEKYNPMLRNFDNAINIRINPDHINLLFSGNGFTRKGLKYVLDTMNKLPDNYHLTVIGKDKNMAFWKKYCIRAEIGRRVHFHGEVSNPEIYYANSDILIHVANYEPFGNVVTESLSCGTPVIVSKYVGAKDLVADGVNGYIVELNTDMIKQHIIKIMQQPDMNSFRENCYKSVSIISYSQHKKQLVEFYNAYIKQYR